MYYTTALLFVTLPRNTTLRYLDVLQFCQLTRDGEVYHDYCLNYSKAMTYLEQLRKNEDFVEFEKVLMKLINTE